VPKRHFGVQAWPFFATGALTQEVASGKADDFGKDSGLTLKQQKCFIFYIL